MVKNAYTELRGHVARDTTHGAGGRGETLPRVHARVTIAVRDHMPLLASLERIYAYQASFYYLRR